jgi:pyruvate,orthophosphate dikinase
MLEQVLGVPGISIDQYINIFQFISHSIKHLISQRFIGVYEPTLERLIDRMLELGVIRPANGSARDSHRLQTAEKFLRDLVARSFGPQLLDNLVGKILHSLAEEHQNLDHGTLSLAMSYDVDRCFVPIDAEDGPQDGVIYLGYKGYMIKLLARHGFQVPPGVILTTELFRCCPAVFAYHEMECELVSRVRQEVQRLERLSGCTFGDPNNPLLLSVRSGAAISMPGMLDTFLNVGINEEIATGLERSSGSAWAAWDCYRRFLQLWGMSHGVPRDHFDQLMREAKQRGLASKKALLPPEEMRELALQYRSTLSALGVGIVEDPFEQLLACVELVMQSWHSEKARLYRREMQIADEWGTAVILQRMVYGNLGPRCGTGVVLSCHPKFDSQRVQLYGDFIIQGQGDDVVSGLVQTHPITELQRRSEAGQASISLERAFPAIYEALRASVEELIYEHGMLHQEIEFTFEGDRPDDLYLLQSRDIVYSTPSSVQAFVPSEELERARTATGIGVCGGALCGRAAHTEGDIAALRRRFHEDAIILMRPDTVPDDIHLVLQVDGLLTAMGGATSHAALVAQRLGRTCVVGCRALQVNEEDGRSELSGHVIKTGDMLSINGMDGTIYLGRHPVTMTNVEGLV